MHLYCSRFRIIWFLILLLPCTAPGQAEEGIHLFLLSGQSNMAGLDPTKSFTPTLAETLDRSSFMVIKDAQGGQPIRRWYKQWKDANGVAAASSGDLYDRLITRTRGAIEGKPIRSITFVWMQGERDAREQHGAVYGRSLKGLVQQLKTDFKVPVIQVVIGRLSDFDMDNKRYPHWTMVRETQVRLAESDADWAWVDTDDLNGPKDDLHYTKEGYRALGTAFAEAALKLLKQRQP